MPSANHVAIIMDGNGRWATGRSHHRVFGHLRGARAAKAVIEKAVNLGLPNLTLFAFSTENWQRPRSEVDFLMRLLVRQLRRESDRLMENNVRFSHIGQLADLPLAVQEVLTAVTERTRRNTGLHLTFAVNYGGRQEIVEAVRHLLADAQTGRLLSDKVNEAVFSSYLPSGFLPDPDLIIRTSGENRLSNFFLWQAAYAEIYVTPKYWPEFTPEDFEHALHVFSQRQRRFGKTGDQIREAALPLSAAPSGTLS